MAGIFQNKVGSTTGAIDQHPHLFKYIGISVVKLLFSRTVRLSVLHTETVCMFLSCISRHNIYYTEVCLTWPKLV